MGVKKKKSPTHIVNDVNAKEPKKISQETYDAIYGTGIPGMRRGSLGS